MFRNLMFTFVFVLTGCTTSMWAPPAYEEKITGFYLVEKEDIVIVSGSQFSYIFEIDQNFKKILSVSRQIEFNSKFLGFALETDNTVTGNVMFNVYSTSYTDEHESELKRLGFTENEFENLDYKTQLRGKRYIVDGSLPFQTLEDDHYVLVKTPEGNLTRAGKIVATPVTIAIDAIAVIPIAAIFSLAGILNSVD